MITLHIISENHDRDEEAREALIPQLVERGFIVGTEALPYPLVGVNGTHGLEDFVYSIYTEVVMAYFSACENNFKGVENAFDTLMEIEKFLKSRVCPEIYIKRFKGELTDGILSRLDNLRSRPEIDDEWFKLILEDIEFFREIIVFYSKNDLFINADLKEEHYVSLRIDILRRFNLMNKGEQFNLAQKVLSELRNIPIVYHIGLLVAQAHEEPQKDVVIIIGENHTKIFEFNQAMRGINEQGVNLVFHNGYSRSPRLILGSPGQFRPHEEKVAERIALVGSRTGSPIHQFVRGGGDTVALGPELSGKSSQDSDDDIGLLLNQTNFTF